MGSVTPGSSAPAVAFYTQQELKCNPSIYNEIVSVINAAFATYADTAGFHKKEPRFTHPSHLAETIGPNGIMATTTIEDQIVATASFIPWRPKVGGQVDQALARDRPEDFKLLAEQRPSYEVKCVVTADTPATSRKGLAGKLVDALLKEVDGRHPGQDVLLWVTIAEVQAGAYWRRRGFERVGETEIFPAGMWGSENDFEFSTLLKRVKSGAGS